MLASSEHFFHFFAKTMSGNRFYAKNRVGSCILVQPASAKIAVGICHGRRRGEALAS